MEEYSLKNTPVSELERLLELYPWYAAARKELFLKMSAMGEEYRKDALHHAVLYLYPDYSVFREGYVLSSAAAGEEDDIPDDGICELDLDMGTSAFPEDVVTGYDGHGPEAEVEIESPVSERKIYVVGGDYFMPDELRTVQGQDIHTLGTSATSTERSDQSDSSEFTDEAFYTETLARIYAEQELYDRANEVYEKLILLYPEKSAYFATLKNDIKKHL